MSDVKLSKNYDVKLDLANRILIVTEDGCIIIEHKYHDDALMYADYFKCVDKFIYKKVKTSNTVLDEQFISSDGIHVLHS